MLAPDGAVLACSTLELAAFAAGDGEPCWSASLPENQEALAGTPLVDRDGGVLLATRQGFVLALDAKGGERWRAHCPEGGQAGPPALGADGRIYLGTRTGSYRQDRFLVTALGGR